MIIGVSGQCDDILGHTRIAGSGKDEVAKRLINNHNFISIAWADVIKRIGQEVYNFSDEQVWGSSDKRSIPDDRYKRDDGTYLTVREFLQTFGTEAGRKCYKDTWVNFGIGVARKLMLGNFLYHKKRGLIYRDHFNTSKELSYTNGYMNLDLLSKEDIDILNNFPKHVNGVVFSDLRFFNEFNAIKAAGGKVVRVKRKIDSEFDLSKMNHDHLSETELLGKKDDEFDYIIDNSGSLDSLAGKIDIMVSELNKRY